MEMRLEPKLPDFQAHTQWRPTPSVDQVQDTPPVTSFSGSIFFFPATTRRFLLPAR